ncbi:hypothetical protein [Methanosarcina sp.]|uniref:hypothetical protein n=1 Tax=Methanosarcina sp. TaxID=2213 RepID=UPI003C74CBE3
MRLLAEWDYLGKLSGTTYQSLGKSLGPALTSYFTFSSAASFAAFNIIDSDLNGFKIFYRKTPDS